MGDTLICRSSANCAPAIQHGQRQFPQSLILCGVRDLQDYRIQSTNEKAVITGGSAFNIKAKSLRLGDFTPA